MVNEISGLKPLFESKLTSVEDALRELEALPDVVPNSEIEKKTSENIVQPVVGHVSDDFYVFEKGELLKVTTKNYKEFLKENDYADIDNCSRLEISKNLLTLDENVINAARDCLIYPIDTDIGKVVIDINHINSKKLVRRLGYNILTSQLMFNLFIPYIKNEAKNNHEVKKTLNEMYYKSEWLEDVLVDRIKIRLGNGNTERIFRVGEINGSFDRTDLNEYGYPNVIRYEREFKYWHSKTDHDAFVRGFNILNILGLSYGNVTTKYNNIGIRLARFV